MTYTEQTGKIYLCEITDRNQLTTIWLSTVTLTSPLIFVALQSKSETDTNSQLQHLQLLTA